MIMPSRSVQPFGQSAVVWFCGAARVPGLALTTALSLGCSQSAATILSPVELLLQTGSPTLLLQKVLEVAHQINPAKIVLCGQSFGVSAAESVVQQLETCGVENLALVALDPRCVHWKVLPSVPTALVHSLMPQHFRWEGAIQFVAPLAPFGSMA